MQAIGYYGPDPPHQLIVGEHALSGHVYGAWQRELSRLHPSPRSVTCALLTAAQGRVELSTIAKFLFPKWGFVCTLVLLCISLLAINISSIIVSAQVTPACTA